MERYRPEPELAELPADDPRRPALPALLSSPLVLWAPLITGATLWGLRVSKAALLAAEYRRKASEATTSDLRLP